MVGTTVVFTTAVVRTWLAYTRLLSASSMSTPINRSAFPFGTMVEIFASPFEYRTWAETAPFLIASPFLSLNRTWYPSLVPARARTDDITPTPIPPTPLMKIFHVSLNRCGAGVEILSSAIFLTRDFGGLFLVIITFSNDGHAMTFVQYVSDTQIDWSIPIFSP